MIRFSKSLVNPALSKSAAGANAPRHVGVIPLGLADGYRPLLGEAGAHVLIDGRPIPIKGVSLEHITLDLTDCEDAEVGDEVVLLGQSGDRSITLMDLAGWQGTRPHHVMMALDGRMACQHAGGVATDNPEQSAAAGAT